MKCGGENCTTEWCNKNPENTGTPPAGSQKRPNPDPEYFGYDVALVPGVKCGYCDERIGNGPFKEHRMFARFGSMMFAHESCWLRDHEPQLGLAL